MHIHHQPFQNHESKFSVDFVDLLEFKLPLLEAPHHWTPAGKAPPHVEDMAARVAKADCYILISPEYNHSMSPALANFLDHFGPKSYAMKPSALCTYSYVSRVIWVNVCHRGGPFGGVRAYYIPYGL